MQTALLVLQNSPDLALVTATAGICLIFLELNRPGIILPGALGLLLLLLGAACLWQHAVQPYALLALSIATAALASNLHRVLSPWLLGVSTLGLMLAFQFLLTPSAGARPIHTATAIGCGGLLGGLAGVLSRIAFRARRAKAIH